VIPFAFSEKSELWSINYKVGDVQFDLPKLTFSEDHISASMGNCPLKFLHVVESDQGLLAHTIGDTGHPNNF